MTDTKISGLSFDKEFHIHITLNSGHEIIYDMQPKLVTARFQELSDLVVFQSGSLVGGRSICWSTGAELSLDEIFLNICYRRE